MPRTEKAHLLDADPSLGAALGRESLRVAKQAIVAPVHRLAPGVWSPEWPSRPEHGGYLMLDGLMVRELAISRGRGVELLARGDLLRPWQEEAVSFAAARLRVLEPTALAELDPPVLRQICRFPPLVDALLARVMQRCRSLAAYAAIQSLTGLENRLFALFWDLAERAGSRGDEGVFVPLRLTHQILADLIGARRPSVTVALSRLAAEGHVIKVDEPPGWLLKGDPPGQRR